MSKVRRWASAVTLHDVHPVVAIVYLATTPMHEAHVVAASCGWLGYCFELLGLELGGGGCGNEKGVDFHMCFILIIIILRKCFAYKAEIY